MKRTKEQQEIILQRVKDIINEKKLTQKQLEEITGVNQGNLGKYLNGVTPLGDGIIYTLVCKLYINPLWLENGELPRYLSPNVEQSNANNGNGTQINNINGDNNVNMTLPKEAWDMLQSQQETIKSQQESVYMAQVNMMEIIKTFNK